MKRIFKYLGLLCFGLLSIFNLSSCEKDGDLKNHPIVEVQEESGIRLKLNRVSNYTHTLSVEATVTPSIAVDKFLVWNLEWSEECSENLSDYIALTISENTSACTVKFLKDFTTRIILKCSLESDTTITSSCAIDCVGRNLNKKLNSNMSFYYNNFSWETGSWNEFFESFGLYDASSYEVTGGTLSGTLQNIQLVSGYIADRDDNVDTRMPFGKDEMEHFDTIYDWFVHYWDLYGQDMSLVDFIEYDNYDLLSLTISYDLYYGDDLVDYCTTKLKFAYRWSASDLQVNSIALNDSQLIF